MRWEMSNPTMSYATTRQCEGEEVIISSSYHLFDVHLQWTELDFKLRKEKINFFLFFTHLHVIL